MPRAAPRGVMELMSFEKSSAGAAAVAVATATAAGRGGGVGGRIAG